jgi:enterobactin synthetase component D
VLGLGLRVGAGGNGRGRERARARGPPTVTDRPFQMPQSPVLPASGHAPPRGKAVFRYIYTDEAGIERWLWLSTGRLPVRVCIMRFCWRCFELHQFVEAGIAVPSGIVVSVRKRQAEFFYGRLVAAACLRELQADSCQVPIGCSREPLWPQGIRGSITHTDTCCAAAAASDRALAGIGIDIEAMSPALLDDATQRTVFTSAEISLLRALHQPRPVPQISAAQCTGHNCPHALGAWRGDSNKDAAVRAVPHDADAMFAFTAAFSAKESFFKAAFAQVRHYFDFDAVAVVAIDIPRRQIQLEVRTGLSVGLPAGTGVKVDFELLSRGEVLTACRL